MSTSVFTKERMRIYNSINSFPFLFCVFTHICIISIIYQTLFLESFDFFNNFVALFFRQPSKFTFFRFDFLLIFANVLPKVFARFLIANSSDMTSTNIIGIFFFNFLVNILGMQDYSHTDENTTKNDTEKAHEKNYHSITHIIYPSFYKCNAY